MEERYEKSAGTFGISAFYLCNRGAKISCRNSGQSAADHFEDILEMVEIGSSAKP